MATRIDFYRSRVRRPYRVRPATKPTAFGEHLVLVERSGKTLFSFEGHTESAFVFPSAHVIVVSLHSPIATGVKLLAYDLRNQKELWKSHLTGIGPVSHSKYRNRINLVVGPSGTIVVFGWEIFGRYVEVVEVHTGKTLGHRKVP